MVMHSEHWPRGLESMYTKMRPKAPGKKLEGWPICSLHKKSWVLALVKQNLDAFSHCSRIQLHFWLLVFCCEQLYCTSITWLVNDFVFIKQAFSTASRSLLTCDSNKGKCAKKKPWRALEETKQRDNTENLDKLLFFITKNNNTKFHEITVLDHVEEWIL